MPSRRQLTGLFAGMGALHFIKPEPFDGIIPPQLPGSPRTYTYASGVAELATAGLLALPRTRRLGGLATSLLSLAVWPGNIYMAYQYRDKTPLKKAIAYGRLPLQLPLIRSGWDIYQGKKK
ncbi:DoxX family protein [Corynebacterium tapiri]|uniref:DoxX family membrane protein n=1 Tax=Corynebacterium tapiri TaxID=1448266 RepID=A0A5C4U256_9CORY|nr:hypothetical protein [Corynebacterium tapiri]TNL96574.1 hypothetical protein FHE74_07705 [Corynebacterium tapiri]